jgi:hypothetical protein
MLLQATQWQLFHQLIDERELCEAVLCACWTLQQLLASTATAFLQ